MLRCIMKSLSAWRFALALLALIGAAGVSAAQDRRVALVIGNDAYKNLTKLQNAANDARSMEARLKALGWETTIRVNSSKREINRAINDFSNKIGAGAAGLFYYAGHGIQSGDRNFLIPVDADIETEVDLRSEAIDVNEIMRLMEEARNRVNIVILDACRDNPLPKRGRSAERGLAVVSAPAGAFVAYAAGPGQKAQDGDPGGNGIFTGELVKVLAEPAMKIEDVFKRVSANVRDRTGGRQVPWVQASLQGDFYFGPPPGSAPVAAAPSAPQPAPGLDREGMFWSSIQTSTSAADYEEYLRQFPNGVFAGLARNKIAALAEKKPAAPKEPTGDQVASLAMPALEPIDREYVVAQGARVREAPNVTARQVGQLREGTKVVVLGKVRGENWFLLEQNGKPYGYVATTALEDPAAFSERSRREAEERRLRQEQDKKAAEDRAQQTAALDAQRQKAEAERRRQEEAQRAIEEARRQAEERERQRVEEQQQRAAAEQQRREDEARRQEEEKRRAEEEKIKRQLAMIVVRPAPGAPAATPAVGVYAPPPAGTVFKDCADGCPDMVVIRPGRYQMGANPNDRDATSGEKPQIIMSLSETFAIGTMEITRQQFGTFVRDAKYNPVGCTTVSFNIVTGLNFGFDQTRKWDNVGFDQTDRHPVVCVSYEDAKAYTKWLSGKTGWNYRLPSESEWEFVARAGSTSVRPWGDNPNDSCQYANVGDMTLNTNSTLSLWPVHSCRDGHAYTAPVGTFPPNNLGAFDMLGNVWEWTEDCWINTLAGYPQDGRPRTSGECGFRTVRGGAWFSTRSETLRTSFRAPEPVSRRAPYIGIRVARGF